MYDDGNNTLHVYVVKKITVANITYNVMVLSKIINTDNSKTIKEMEKEVFFILKYCSL